MPTVKIVPFPGAPGPSGAQGPRGYQGETGLTGATGQSGASAYEIAVENGFEGTEQEWLDSLGGGNADIADFVFNYDEEESESTMTIHNHDMTIRTTRDGGQDSDIFLNSADDIWIRANDTIELESTTDEVRILTGEDGQNEWKFREDGIISSDNNFLSIESLSSEDVKGRLKFEPSNGRALLQAYSSNQTATFTDSWDTAIWTVLDSQQSQLTLTNALSVISFMDATGYQVDNLKISVNGSYYAPYSGAGSGDGSITLYINELMPPEEEFTLTELRFQYAFSSKIDIDFDEGDLLVATQDEMDIVLESSEDVRIKAQDDIVFTTNWNTENTQYEWRMNNNGTFELPANGYIENPAGSSGDGYGNDTLKLVPDSNLVENGSDQYLIVDPTSPNHIHIRSGGDIDASSAYLILGGEKNNVIVSDGDRNVYVNSRQPLVMNSYTNLDTQSSTAFAASTSADIQVGYNVNVGGTDYTVTAVEPFDEGVVVVYADGAVFDGGGSYTFTYDGQYTNQWTFSNSGTLYGPTEPGWLQVSGIYGEAGSNTNIMSQENLVLAAGENQGVYVGDSNSGANEVATIGDLSQITPVETSFTVNGGTTANQPTFDGAPLFSGSYVKTGPLVFFQIQVDMDNITDFGSGQYYVDLPFDAKYPILLRDGCLHDESTGNEWSISGHVAAGTNRLFLFYTAGTGQDEFFDYNSPITLNALDNFHVSGTYIAA